MRVVEVAVVTHPGLVRRRNEDAAGVSGLGLLGADSGLQTVSGRLGEMLVVVADGLGGHPSGDVASRLAATTLLALGPSSESSLSAAVSEANEAIFRSMHDAPEMATMGSTIVSLLATRASVVVANVGDSPGFEYVLGRLHELSTPDVPPRGHTLPGVPSSIVTQTLGGTERPVDLDVHLWSDDLAPGEDRRFLLCSDGLTNFVPLPEVARALDLDATAAVESLLDLALAAGAPDNVTIAVVDIV